MRRQELGNTGVLVPEIGIGTWNYCGGPGPLRRGLEAGALLVDTAESYGSESVVGAAVKGIRDRVFLATKVSPVNFRRVNLLRSLDSSLRSLGTDFIDLLQLHAPSSDIPIAETMGAMAEAVDAGKVRFVGVSNFSITQLQEAQAALGRHRIVSNQVRYNLIDRSIEGGLLQHCQLQRITVIAYSPLGRDLGRIRDCDPTGVLVEIARATKKSPAQIAINWCLSRQGVIPIPKGNSTEHILDNCGASDWRLTPDQIVALDARIQFRHRGLFDVLVRRHLPHPLQAIASRGLRVLPRGIRRRLT
jgi:diketogulonate reductase-like aldo/keto reductase